MYLCLTPLVQGNIGKIEHSLWLAEPYRDSRVAGATGVVYRLIIMATAVIFGACMLAFAPRKKTIFSLAGQNSLIVFIFHGYLVQYLNDFVTFDPGSFTGIALMALISVGTTIFLSLPIFHTVYMRLMGLIQRCVLRQTT
jgi:fucose 4-O-acetylase-like acetyltransferase